MEVSVRMRLDNLPKAVMKGRLDFSCCALRRPSATGLLKSHQTVSKSDSTSFPIGYEESSAHVNPNKDILWIAGVTSFLVGDNDSSAYVNPKVISREMMYFTAFSIWDDESSAHVNPSMISREIWIMYQPERRLKYLL